MHIHMIHMLLLILAAIFLIMIKSRYKNISYHIISPSFISRYIFISCTYISHHYNQAGFVWHKLGVNDCEILRHHDSRTYIS